MNPRAMSREKKIQLLEDAVLDPILSDGAFRMVAAGILFPKKLTKKDFDWARKVIKELLKPKSRARRKNGKSKCR